MDADDDGHGARREHKRRYIRQFMQEYREKQRIKKDTMRCQIERLEARVAALQKAQMATSGLPWQDVAQAMRDLRRDSVAKRQRMKQQVEDMDLVIAELKRWVLVNDTSVQTSLSMHQTTWQDMTLLSQPLSRQLGKEWITRKMFCNVDRMFQAYNVPPHTSPEPYNSMSIQFNDDGYQFLQRAHLMWNAPLETVVAAYRDNPGSMFTLDGFCPRGQQARIEAAGNTYLHEYIPSSKDGLYSNLLCAEFEEHDRTILVITHIPADDCASCPLPDRHRQRQRMVWIELRRASDSTTRERFLCLVSHATTSAGHAVSMEELSLQWGTDLSRVPPESREAMFLQAYRAFNAKLREPRRRWYDALLP